MNTLHLFAGAGGGLLADLILGHNPVGAVEHDKYCCKILRARAEAGWFPNLRVLETDIRMFDPSEFAGRVDCVSAGWPCQDISVAGNGAGIGGEKSGLWSEVVRTVRELRPRFVFLENSPAIVSRGIGVVFGDLAGMGYDARWLVLGASAVGAPHLRARWWCLAQFADFASTRRKKDGNIGNGQKKPMLGCDGEIHRTGFDWWTVESYLGRVVHGLAHRVDRLRAIGNGQVPLQAAVAWRLLAFRG